MPQGQSIIGYVNQHGSITTLDLVILLSVKTRRAREILKEMPDATSLLDKGLKCLKPAADLSTLAEQIKQAYG